MWRRIIRGALYLGLFLYGPGTAQGQSPSPSPSVSPSPSLSPVYYAPPLCEFIGEHNTPYFDTIRVSGIPDLFEGDLLVAYRSTDTFSHSTVDPDEELIQIVLAPYFQTSISSSDIVIPHDILFSNQSAASPVDYMVEIRSAEGRTQWRCALFMYYPEYTDIPSFSGEALGLSEMGMGGGAGTAILGR